MKYTCTRNRMESVEAAQAIAQGISASGGLFVPEQLPQITYADLCRMQNMSYVELAEEILGRFLTDFTADEIRECAEAAYSPEKFSGGLPVLERRKNHRRGSGQTVPDADSNVQISSGSV